MQTTESLGLTEAKATIEAMIEEAAKEPSQPVAMAVVDNRGDPILLARMDGANSFNRLMALRKATTAVMIGVDTSLFGQMMPSLNMSITDFGTIDITIVPGGICVRKPGTGAIVGGVGVSGRVAQEDERLARVGLEKLKALLSQ